ncbi:MAG: hypothetical protein WC325_01685 [Candidatus Bathyarchaeia archaeon]|jgi:hypothetical protein
MSEAKDLIKRGEELYAQKKYFEAKELFQEAHLLSDDVYALYMLAYSNSAIAMEYVETKNFAEWENFSAAAVYLFEWLLSEEISDEMRQKSSGTLTELKTLQESVKQMKERVEQKMKEFADTDFME